MLIHIRLAFPQLNQLVQGIFFTVKNIYFISITLQIIKHMKEGTP